MRILLRFRALALVLALLPLVCDVNAQTNVVPDNIELAVLKNIYDSLGGTGWTTKTNWPAPGNWPATATSAQFGTWFGVTVSNGDIQRIALSGNDLVGPLPASLSQLTRMKQLYLGSNQISGSIPSSLGGLTQLQNLYLNNNQLSGAIPLAITNMTAMTKLKLENNGLTGSIPSALGNLTLLNELYLHNNDLSGQIPASLGSLTALTHLYLRDNQFTGSLPAELGALTDLEYFYINNNQITGALPSSFSAFSSLLVFDASGNQLAGPMPDISSWTQVTQINVRTNQLSGAFPAGVGSCTALTILRGENNFFSSLPPGLLGLPVILTVNFENNDIRDIPDFSQQVNKAGLTLQLKNNQLDFAQLATLVGQGINSITYSPQKQLADITVLNVPIGGTLLIPARARGQNGTTTWQFRQTGSSSWFDINNLNEDATHLTFKKSNMQLTDKGDIKYRMTNTDFPGLIIESIPMKFSTGYDIVWEDYTGVSVNGNTITKTAANGWGTGGAASANELPASTDGWIEFVYDNSTCGVVFGFSDTNADAGNTTIDYGISVNGTQQQIVQNGTVAGTYTVAVGDALRIERTGSSMEFYRNGTLIHTLNSVSTGVLIGDAAINGTGCKIFNARSSFWIPAVQGQVPDIWESETLKDLYDSLGGPAWINKTNWPTSGSWGSNYTSAQMDTWFGVVVVNGDIITLNLLENNLTGEIPESFSRLTKLANVDFRINNISGLLPESLTSMVSLKQLKLHQNQLTGEIPGDIGDLVNLEYLSLSRNNFSGVIPESIGNLTKLYWLALYTNFNLSGTLPDTLYTLTNLTDFYIFDTQIGGTLSEEIGNLTKLKQLWAYNNNLSGALPAAVGSITTLQKIYLYSNDFTGEIPTSWRNLTNVQVLWLHFNQLTGEVPPWLGELTQMVELSIGDNNLTGVIPPTLSNLTNMTGLYLQRLDIGGTIPQELSALNKLTVIDLKFTNLEGEVPAWLMNLPTLKEFRLNNSKFTGLANFASRTDKASLIINVENNRIPVSQLETYFTGSTTHPFNTFTYGPQEAVDIDTVIHAPSAAEFRIEAPDAGTHGVYVWEKLVSGNWTDIGSENESSQSNIFLIQSAAPEDQGTYRYTVTNAWLPDIHFESGPIEVSITDPINTETKPLYNGLITSVRWRTNGAHGVDEGNLNGMYAYTYDDKYQIKDASWADDVNYVTNDFTWAGNKFRLTGMAFDPNGNILTLSRYDKNALRIHNFTYAYQANTNKLTSVSGYTNAYTYNAIGQMIGEDKVTGGDQYVEYDVTGKVTAVYSDETKTAKKVQYLYDDRGFRLAKVSLVGDTTTTWYIRDASGNVITIYEQKGEPGESNTNDLVPVEIPIYGSGKLGTYYPQQNGSTAYEVTDHLGNVRALLRENVMVYTATMEDNDQSEITNPRVQEMNYFQNIFETEVDDVHMNHTASTATLVSNPSKSAYLFWQDGMTGMEAEDKAVGPAIALKVNAGDTVKAETFVRYENKISYSRTGFTLSLLSSILGNSFNYVGGFEGSTLSETTQSFSSALTAGGFFSDGSDDTRPYAYLNYIVFDADMESIVSDWVRVGEDGGFDPGEEGLPDMHGKVELETPLVIPSGGKYIYIWVSNESEDTRVWFDDLAITHVSAFVAQATDYGVWGDVIREQKTDESFYRYGYQGQFAERDEETGWNHFELREYDPVIGRWTAIDPMKQFWSPYVGMGNEPIGFIDSDGGYTKGGASWRWAAAWLLGMNPTEIYSSAGEYGFNTSSYTEGEVVITEHFGDERSWLTALNWNEDDEIVFSKVTGEYYGRYNSFKTGNGIEPVYWETAFMPLPKGLGAFTGAAKASRSLGATSSALKTILPAWRKVNIALKHIVNNHTSSGSGAKQSGNKSLFPKGMDAKGIEQLVRDAYRNVHTKVQTQGDRVLLRGSSQGRTVEMWLNKATNTIETAYPVN